MPIIVGSHSPQWGHTYLAEGFGKLYALRSLQEGSYLCVYTMPQTLSEVMTPDDLENIGEFPTPGQHSCHITLLEKQAVLSDYTSGTLSLFNLDDDGVPEGEPELIRFEGCGPDQTRQTSSHVHSSWISPDGNSLVVVDLGSDRIYRYSIIDGRLETKCPESFDLPAGCGPRHCAFKDEILYVATELSDEVLVYSYRKMELLQRIKVNEMLPHGGGHIVVSQDKRYMYVSSRLDNDGIATFLIRPDGMLEKISYHKTGSHPRHFALSDDGNLLICVNRDSNNIEWFRTENGILTKQMEHHHEKPVFILIK